VGFHFGHQTPCTPPPGIGTGAPPTLVLWPTTPA
jgi:hypothetical protein